MIRLKLFQVDAFAEWPFEGNPAAVCPLDEWLDDRLLQAIAAENNLSETAFFSAEDDGFRLRWFTPAAEVDLCGHATLATAHVLFEHLGWKSPKVRFFTRSGQLLVTRDSNGLVMDFPASRPRPATPPASLLEGLGAEPAEVLAAEDYVAVFPSEDHIRALAPNFALLGEAGLRGVLATAPGRHHDFVSRCFFPALDVNEDPVTGSAHCQLAPLWAERLGRNELIARQLSSRGGVVHCRVKGDRVALTGKAVDYLAGEIRFDERVLHQWDAQ